MHAPPPSLHVTAGTPPTAPGADGKVVVTRAPQVKGDTRRSLVRASRLRRTAIFHTYILAVGARSYPTVSASILHCEVELSSSR
eukprot:5283131-Prymnesium_polylepis.1